MSSVVQHGDVYVHVGGAGIPASGLRLVVVEVDSARHGFWAVYPDRPNSRVWYRGLTLGPRYVREDAAA